MSTQMDLIDMARDMAISRVDRNANTDWKEAAYRVGVMLAKQQATVISEDIVDRIPPGFTTHEKRAMGAVMKRLQKEKFISPTDQFVKSPSPVGHGRPSRVWKCLVFGGEQ